MRRLRWPGSLINDRTVFVVVNVAVNLLFLLRSYVTMRTLTYSDLGLVALLQTIILLVSALQLGVVNGGYRLVCSEDAEGVRTVNDFVYTFVCALAVVMFAAGAVAALWSGDRDYEVVTFLAIFAGLLTILKNWTTNFLIAKVMLPAVNRVNFLSAVVSIVPLIYVRSSPLLICLGSIILQPLAFVACVLVFLPELRPTALRWSLPVFKRIMAAGFIVFLTSVFLVANTQIERWSILSYLGTDGLGRFYLALVFLNLYTLVPTSLDAIYLPKLVQSYGKHDYARMRHDMRRFLGVLMAYSVAAVLCVWLLAPPFLDALLPKYLNDLEYVYLVLPGVVLFGLTGPFAMVFNVLMRYRFYFYAYGLGTLATAALLAGYIYSTDTITLRAVSIIKTVVYLAMGAVIIAGYLASSREQPGLRFAT